MDIGQLRTVVAVAEDMHFTRAAERLALAQSAVSARVVALEHELGVALFTRTSRTVALTAAGEMFVTRARSLITELDQLHSDVRSLSGTLRGSLRIGIITSGDVLDLSTVLAEFRERFPDVHVLVKPQLTPTTISEVAENTLDVGFVSLAGTALPRGLVKKRLWSERLVALVRPDHNLAVRPEIHAHDLAPQPMIDFPVGTGSRAQSDRLFATAGLVRTVTTEAYGADAIADLVRAGLGVGLVASTYASARDDLVTVPIARSPERTVHMLYRAGDASETLQAFRTSVESRTLRIGGAS